MSDPERLMYNWGYANQAVRASDLPRLKGRCDKPHTAYIRADIHEAALATARREARGAALEEAAALVDRRKEFTEAADLSGRNHHDKIAFRIRALRTQAPT
jgi:hypothetical protein